MFLKLSKNLIIHLRTRVYTLTLYTDKSPSCVFHLQKENPFVLCIHATIIDLTQDIPTPQAHSNKQNLLNLDCTASLQFPPGVLTTTIVGLEDKWLKAGSQEAEVKSRGLGTHPCVMPLSTPHPRLRGV